MNDCCNQKRDCASKVAPVKLSYHKYEDDDYHTMWREDLQIIAKGLVAIIAIMLFGFVGILALVVN